tara:strand:- start:862 stop:1344 length:483 start_codon:yes stop_codon:yes gene_type:complete
MVEVSTFEQQVQLHLSPNRSATWQQTKFLMASFGLFISSIAIAWAFAGAWVILPFAGIEVGLLTLIMYLVSKATYQWQTVLISPQTIFVQCSNGAYLRFPRHDTSLYFFKDTEKKRLPRLVLQTHLQQFELGAFLNADDKQRVHDSLKTTGIMICTNKWW